MKHLKGSLLLLLAAFFWGTSFAAQASVADTISPFAFNGARSLIGSLFLFLLFLALGRRHGGLRASLARPEVKLGARIGALMGLVLFAAANLQQYGIAAYPAEAAASGRSGFLTATYVVMVALSAPLLGKKLHPLVALSALLCLGGMYLLCTKGGDGGLYLADLLLLGCALCFTVQILLADRYSAADSVVMSCVQFLICGLLSLGAALLFERPAASDFINAWPEILYLGIFSSGVAFTLQFVAQKYTEPAVASIMMSFESVFAALAGWVLLGERLSGRELLGCALVFCAVLLSELPGFFARDAGKHSSIHE